MENPKSKLSPQEIFNNKKLFSNKIHARVLKLTEEILKSIDKLKIVNKDKNLLLSSVNHYYYDLCAVIFHLRQVVVHIGDDDKQTVSDLQEVITELNKIALVVQESLNLETEKLIIQVKNTVIDVGLQVERLIKIIEYDNLHEHKQKILDLQHDLVISVKALKLYCQGSYLTLSELEESIHEEIEKTKNYLIQLKTGHEHMKEDFMHYIRHSVQNLQDVANYMRKQNDTENFQKDIKNVIKTADEYGVLYISDILQAVVCDNPMSKMLEVIENCHANVRKASLEFQKGLQAIDIETKDNQKIKQLFIHIYINGVKALSALNQSIEDAILKK